MKSTSSIPDSAPPFNYRNQLVRNLVSKHCLGSGIQDPHHGLPSPLPYVKWYRYLQCYTTTCCASLRSYPEKRRHGINGKCEVEDGVERKVVCGRSAGDQRTSRVWSWWGGCSETLEYQSHVLAMEFVLASPFLVV